MKKILSLICFITMNGISYGQIEMNWFSDINICESLDTTINFPSGNYQNYSFTWFYEGDSLTTDSHLTNLTTGNYSLELYEIDTTSITADTIIDGFYALVDVEDFEFLLTFINPDINIDSIADLCIEDNPTLITPHSNRTHFWFLDGMQIGEDEFSENTLVIENIIDQINYNQEHQYQVEIETACGIFPSKNSISLKVNECHCALNMPNIFTPNNGDDINNTFKPINNHELEEDAENMCQSTDFNMEIFNQWGRHISSIKSGDEYPSWDGKNKNGNDVAAGIYFYRIVYQVNIFTDAEEREITGFVHLYR